jgi:DNA-binding transcriptional MerR regulator
MNKSAEAFRTIGEVADELEIPKHVLRFWEGRFPQIRPMKRGGGRRYYRPEDMELLRGIRALLHAEGYTIRGVQKILREHGVDQVKAAAQRAAPVQASAGTVPPQARKRGRKPIVASAARVSARQETPPVPELEAPACSMNVHVLSAIRELQIARAILLGQPIAQSSAPVVAEAKKARASRT